MFSAKADAATIPKPGSCQVQQKERMNANMWHIAAARSFSLLGGVEYKTSCNSLFDDLVKNKRAIFDQVGFCDKYLVGFRETTRIKPEKRLSMS
mmetsp:Transcript_33374/g.70133  ORF Transcript_33374/g.70133 Transcript_33374/m.70133 type:complete len:94 (+) Transcript_33374:1282-1563(+)